MSVLEQTTLLLADYSVRGQTKLNYNNWGRTRDIC